MTSPWTTRREVADYLRVCPDTVDAMLAKGEMRYQAVVINGIRRIRILREDVYRRCPLPKQAPQPEQEFQQQVKILKMKAVRC